MQPEPQQPPQHQRRRLGKCVEEINFQRLLARCERLFLQGERGGEEQAPRDGVLVERNLRTLQQLLAEVARRRETDRDEEGQRVSLEELSAKLQSLCSLCPPASVALISEASPPETLEAKAPSDLGFRSQLFSLAETRQGARSTTGSLERREEQMSRTKKVGQVKGGSGTAIQQLLERTDKEDLRSHNALELDRYMQEQDVLLDDMLDLVSSLRDYGEKTSELLKTDQQELEQVEQVTIANLDGVKGVSSGISAQLTSNSAYNLSLCLLLAFVAMTFVSMVMLMKLIPKPR